MNNLILHEYLLAKLTQTLIQSAQFLYWDKEKCFFLGTHIAKKGIP